MKIELHADTEKQAQMLKLLQFGTVMVFVDSRHSDLIVPGHLKNNYQLRLNFDYAYEIDDFRVLPDRIEASLSFNKKDFFCVVPYTAVYLIMNHSIQHGALFVPSVPVEMLQYFADVAQGEEEREKNQAKHLSAVAGDAAPMPRNKKSKRVAKQTTVTEEGEQKTPRKKGHLRLVK